MRNQFPVGSKVQIVMGAGLDQGKFGVVIEPELDERGIPRVDGAYQQFRPMGEMAERMLLLEDGTKTVMFVSLLKRVLP